MGNVKKKGVKNTTFSKIVKKRGENPEIVNKKHKNYTQKRYYNFKKGHFLGPFLIWLKLDKKKLFEKKIIREFWEKILKTFEKMVKEIHLFIKIFEKIAK